MQREETDGGSFREGVWELAHEQRTERVLFHRGSKMLVGSDVVPALSETVWKYWLSAERF